MTMTSGPKSLSRPRQGQRPQLKGSATIKREAPEARSTTPQPKKPRHSTPAPKGNEATTQSTTPSSNRKAGPVVPTDSPIPLTAQWVNQHVLNLFSEVKVDAWMNPLMCIERTRL